MTTQISLRKPAPAFKGFGTLTWMTFVKHVTDPASLGFALGLPIMMYTMFGVGKDYSDVWMVGGECCFPGIDGDDAVRRCGCGVQPGH